MNQLKRQIAIKPSLMVTTDHKIKIMDAKEKSHNPLSLITACMHMQLINQNQMATKINNATIHQIE